VLLKKHSAATPLDVMLVLGMTDFDWVKLKVRRGLLVFETKEMYVIVWFVNTMLKGLFVELIVKLAAMPSVGVVDEALGAYVEDVFVITQLKVAALLVLVLPSAGSKTEYG